MKLNPSEVCDIFYDDGLRLLLGGKKAPPTCLIFASLELSLITLETCPLCRQTNLMMGFPLDSNVARKEATNGLDVSVTLVGNTMHYGAIPFKKLH